MTRRGATATTLARAPIVSAGAVSESARTDRCGWSDSTRPFGTTFHHCCPIPRIQEEYERQKNQAPAQEPRRLNEIAQEILKLRGGISRMLDLYQDGDLEKAEFEPRHRRARQRLSELEAEAGPPWPQSASRRKGKRRF